jgi:hypothetical protein
MNNFVIYKNSRLKVCKYMPISVVMNLLKPPHYEEGMEKEYSLSTRFTFN